MLLALAGQSLPAAATSRRLSNENAETRANEAGIRGRVLLAESPVVEARVFAYQMVEKSIHKVLTDGRGAFLFESLPAGIYKIIAHKAGLEPAVMLLRRAAMDEAQVIELALSPQEASTQVDFWSVRGEIPGDVLREIDAARLAQSGRESGEPIHGVDPELRAELSAVTGIDEMKPEAHARMSGGNVGVVGKLGDVRVFLEGDFQSLESEPAFKPGLMAVDGSSRSVSLSLQTPNQGDFNLASTANRLTTSENGLALPVEASQYRFGWNREFGESASTSIRGYYLEESGLYNKGWVEPLELPFASRTFAVEGNYSYKLQSGNNLRAGMRYRERSGSYSKRLTGSSDDQASEFLDAFGGGDWALTDAVMLEYGLFTTLRDGSVSITPRGGVVVKLGADWQSSIGAAHRIAIDADPYFDDFLPVFVEGSLDCSESEIACYELSFQRGAGAGDHFAFGGSYRELDATVRMFFSNNFFDHTEGLFLVPGDALPESHASFRKRLSPTIVTHASASFAQGGGGIYRAVNRRFFENNVELLSTSLDTTFEATSTGVFVAFHRLEQVLEPVAAARRRSSPTTAGLERLELVVNQNLSALLNLSTDWAVRLGMELARGASFFHSDVDPEALRRQVMTGVAVRF